MLRDVIFIDGYCFGESEFSVCVGSSGKTEKKNPDSENISAAFFTDNCVDLRVAENFGVEFDPFDVSHLRRTPAAFSGTRCGNILRR